MRPERLEVEGFTAFRQPTVVDFEGAELFALTGPTGAGKSSVIDAMTFALYGSVPRYANKTLVAPVISQGQVEARVRFDFSVAGVGYTAVRVVRAATKGGATTKEARLERRPAPGGAGGEPGDGPGEVLAGNPDELTAAVEGLLGLSFEHFTTCVVLPQGEFMRFLHQKAADRQDLLVSLLDLRLFGDLRRRAGVRATQAEARHATLAARLEERRAVATPELVTAVKAELVALEGLLAEVDATTPRLAELEEEVRRAADDAEVLREQAALLAGVSVPEDLDALGSEAEAARRRLEAARAAEEAAEQRRTEADAAVAALPARHVLERQQADHAAVADLDQRLARGTKVVAEARAMAADAREAAEEAAAAHDEAVSRLENARRANRAEEFLAALAPGEACPICGQVVHDVPTHVPGDVDAAQAAVTRAERRLHLAREAVESTSAKSTKADATFDERTRQRAEVAERLAAAPPADQVAAALDALVAAEAAARAAGDEAGAARRERVVAEQAVATAVERQSGARSAFDAVRDAVAALGPPPAGRTDLAADWAALRDWAEQAGTTVAEDLAAADGAAKAAGAARRELIDQLVAAAEVVGVRVEPAGGGRPPARGRAGGPGGDDARHGADDGPVAVSRLRDATVERLAEARADLTSVEQALAEVAALEQDVADALERQQVAGSLAGLLRSNKFEKWVLDSVLEGLTRVATLLLTELSGGAYSLVLDAKSRNFAVCDHNNADLVRPARTLSGGETFLVSLALALALADQVADLAAAGAARLEAIFLDEGFGTLDPDTLQTVADTLEVLRAQGRTVGVVTHVTDLAEQLPVRFEVRKAPGGSTVERVEG